MDHLRNAHLFDASQLRGSTAIIGCGATGSAVALLLAKLGVQDIDLYDHDTIQSHNIPNQLLYNESDLEGSKADTLRRRLILLTSRTTGCIAKVHEQKVQSSSGKLNHQRVILCVDSMAARREIVERCIRFNGVTELLLDVRMGAYNGQVLACDPRSITQYQEYMDCWYDDQEVLPQHVAACGTIPTLVHTATMLASVAVQLFTVRTTTVRRPAEVLVDMEHWTLSTRDSAVVD